MLCYLWTIQKTVGILHFFKRNTLQGTDTYPTKREVRKIFAPWGSPLVSPSGKKSGLNLLICSIQNYRYPYTPPWISTWIPHLKGDILFGVSMFKFPECKCWKDTVQEAKSSRVSQAFCSISGRWNIETLMQGTWGIYSDQSKELNTPEKMIV